MANTLQDNITRPLMRMFLPAFESKRSISKNVDTQLFQGKFNPSTGDTVDVKRPHDYVTLRSARGDITGQNPNDITSGKASAVVQEQFTVLLEYEEWQEALELDQKGKPGEGQSILGPAAQRIVTDVETDFTQFAIENTGPISGTYGTAATTWDHVANWGASMKSAGVPEDGRWYAAVNPFTETALASGVVSLGAGGAAGSAINQSLNDATIRRNFAGMDVMTSTTLSTVLSGSGADRTGAINGTPDSTYLTARNTFQQSIPVDGFNANLAIKAGEMIRIAAVSSLNQSTRKTIITAAGAQVPFAATVAEDVTLDGAGAGTIVIGGPAIFETGKAYNTVDAALADNMVIELLGAADTLVQPNLVWHKNAFSIASIPVRKLHSTDTVATTEDGLSFRVSMGSDFYANDQHVRIDFRAAYGVMNQYMAYQGFGS